MFLYQSKHCHCLVCDIPEAHQRPPCGRTSFGCCVQAEPLDGGHLLGAGRLWVAPEAETDDRAVRVQMTGKDLPTESLVRAYLPQVDG